MFSKLINDLYYTKQTIGAEYSETPSPDLSPERLLNGLPAFKRIGFTGEKIKKKIILPFLNRIEWNAEQYALALKKVAFLINSGFEVYAEVSGKLELLEEDDLQAPVYSMAMSADEVSVHLNIPADEFIMLSGAVYDEFLVKPFNSAEDFAPYSCIDTRNLTDEAVLGYLLSKHAHQVEYLICNAQWFTFFESRAEFASTQFSKLKRLKLDHYEINAHSLQALLAHTPQLEVLDLSSCTNISSDALKNLSSSSLKKLDVRFSDINTQFLQALLVNATQLEELDLSVCKNLSGDALKNLSLSSLKKLRLIACGINTHTLQALLTRHPQLEELSCSKLNDLSPDFLNQLHLSALKKLNVRFSDINTESLHVLLAKASQLEELICMKFTNLSASTLNSLNLSSLKKFDFSYSNINTQSLQALLVSATQLEELELYYCTNLATGTLANLKLSSLKKLRLCYSKINTQSLQALLAKASQLEELDLTGCQNISAEAIKDIINSLKLVKYYPPLALTTSLKTRTSAIKDKPPSDTYAVDANTAYESNTTFNVTQYFIGNPLTPVVNELRLRAYGEMTLNQQSADESSPFLFQSSSKGSISGREISQEQRRAEPLIAEFNQQKGTEEPHYLGRFELHIGPSWMPIPSVHASEELMSYYIKEDAAVRIQKNDQDGFYYIKTLDEKKQTINMEVLLKAPKVGLDTAVLPEDVKALISMCLEFGEEPLRTFFNASAQEYMDALISQQVGACRHRSAVFKYLMEKRHPNLPVQVIFNECHAFAEVFYQGQWISCQLGGYDAELNINNDAFAQDIQDVVKQDTIKQHNGSISILDSAQQRIPLRRFRPIDPKLAAQHIVAGAERSCLLNTDQPLACAYALQQICRDTHKPFFYVDNPSQLSCNKPYIQQQGQRGFIKKGPGGPLYEFLQAHPDGIVIIDYSAFKPQDIVRFNSLLDEMPKVDGIPLAQQKVIGIMNAEAPGAYQGADFYSRFKQKQAFTLPAPLKPPAVLAHAVATDSDTLVIDLMDGDNWEAALLGHWLLQGKNLIRQESLLLTELHKYPQLKRLVFNNPPTNNAEYDRFVQDISLHKGIYTQGKLVHAFAHELPEISVQHHVDLMAVSGIISWPNEEPLPAEILVLNPTTLNVLLGTYVANEARELHLKPGLIETYPTKVIPLYMTGTLSSYQWQRLAHCAQQHGKTFSLHLAPGVELPDALHAPQPISYKVLPKSQATRLELNPPEPGVDAIVLEVSELQASDLLPSVHAQFNDKELDFSFTAKSGFLHEQLAAGKKVILQGNWSEELAQALHPLMLQRLHESHPKGELILVGQVQNNAFPLLPIAAINPITPPKPIPLKTASFAQRLTLVEEALQGYPFVFLSGPTGAGKTHFIQNLWAKKYPACYFGESALRDWAKNTGDAEEWVTLFIDEANITDRQWSEFQGLLQKPPIVFLHGEYIELSPKHRVIFAGNPLAYGGERSTPELFKSPHPIIEFKPMRLQDVVAECHLPQELEKPFQDVIDYISTRYPNAVYLTPRECIMMAAFAQVLGKPELIAYELTRPHLPASEREAFDLRFKPQDRTLLEVPNLPHFELTPNMQPAAQALMAHLALRSSRLHGAPLPKGGLGGLILEGEPGMGKSELLIASLLAQGLKNPQDFCHIPVSLNTEEKTQRLLEAFHQGKIIIIDEINSSPLLERLLNALLEGHDLENNPAKNPGFLLLGTQNPISMRGRVATTQPLLHRLQTVSLTPYSTEEMHRILTQKYQLPSTIAVDMIAEYQAYKQADASLCFRDLQHWAQHWVKAEAHTKISQLAVEPKPSLLAPGKEHPINQDKLLERTQIETLSDRHTLSPSLAKQFAALRDSINQLKEYSISLTQSKNVRAHSAGQDGVELAANLNKILDDEPLSDVLKEGALFQEILEKGYQKMSEHRRLVFFHSILIGIASVLSSIRSLFIAEKTTKEPKTSIGKNSAGFLALTTRQEKVGSIKDELNILRETDLDKEQNFKLK